MVKGIYKIILFSSISFITASCMMNSNIQVIRTLKNDIEIEDYFISETEKALIKAIQVADIDEVQFLIEQGININSEGVGGMTPLLWALVKQKYDLFKLLVENSADPHIRFQLPQGFQEYDISTIDLAARLEDPKYLLVILENGGNPNFLVNERVQSSVINRAIIHRRLENIQNLIEFGADINHRDISNQTPIFLAVTSNLYEIAVFLLREGADPTINTELGSNAVDMVTRYGSMGVNKSTNDEENFHIFMTELEESGYL